MEGEEGCLALFGSNYLSALFKYTAWLYPQATARDVFQATDEHFLEDYCLLITANRVAHFAPPPLSLRMVRKKKSVKNTEACTDHFHRTLPGSGKRSNYIAASVGKVSQRAHLS